MEFELETLPEPERPPAVAPAAEPAAPEVPPEIDPGARRRAVALAPIVPFDMEADRRLRLIAHRRRQDEIVRDAQLGLVRRVAIESRLVQAIFCLPVAAAVPAGLVQSFRHWPAFTVVMAVAGVLWAMRGWRAWVLAPAGTVERSATIPAEGWVDLPAPGEEPPEAAELVARRTALRAVNDAARELELRRGIAWRQLGGAAAGWIIGVVMPLMTGGMLAHVFIAGAGGAAAGAAVAWVCAVREWAVPVVGLTTTLGSLLGAMLFCSLSGMEVGARMVYALPMATMLGIVLGMAVGWWLEHRDGAAPQRSL